MRSNTTDEVERPIREFPDREALDSAFEKELITTDVVLDIGCGIRPFCLFRPKIHLMVEAFEAYIPHLQHRFGSEIGAIPLLMKAPDDLIIFPDKSVDTVLIFDVVEHLGKIDGWRLISHAERIARRQVVILTPLGFLEQDVLEDEVDGWGFNNGHLQSHRSCWYPEEFKAGWDCMVCSSYHDGEDGPVGAFYAIKTFSAASVMQLPRRTLFASNLVLPEAQTAFPQLQSAVFHALSGLDPNAIGILTHRNFRPYNSRITDDLVAYAMLRLPCLYFSLGNRRTETGMLFPVHELGAVNSLDDISNQGTRQKLQDLRQVMVDAGFERFVVLDQWGNYFILAALLWRIFRMDSWIISLGDETEGNLTHVAQVMEGRLIQAPHANAMALQETLMDLSENTLVQNVESP